MQVRLLGPVDILDDDASRPVQGLRRRAILAALALRPGEIVSADRLIGIVWGEGAPRTAATTLRSHVTHLRRLMGGPAAILSRSPGYVLHADGDITDVQVAERLIRQAGQCDDVRQRESILRAATALWRDRPLADLTVLAWFDDEARRLDDLLLRARQLLIDTRLALGRHLQLIPELEALSRTHPLHEQIHGQLMLALYRAGRQGDALATYRKLSRTLTDDLGIGPSRALRDLEGAILRQDPDLDVPPTGSAAGPIPAQLPPAIAAFTGRDQELARLNGLLPDRGTVIISAISGTAGIGKTTLAVHWAHQIAARFPDGQLYLNLRGYDPDGSALDPAEAIRVFLEALGVPDERIPMGADAQVGLYRSLLAGKRILVVLDNARDAGQVRPLLPGSPGCLAIVTSRNQLAPLVATAGAHLLTLDLLSTAEARELLVRRIGADRVAEEPGAVEEIVSRCARLPLALAVTAARAATHPQFPLGTLAVQLREADTDLGAFDGGDPFTDVRAAFSWSYKALSPEAARLFRLLSLHPGSDIGLPAAASLAGIPRGWAGRLLTELVQAHLLSEHTAGRYSFHDLLRAYAREQARIHDGEADRHAATHRVLDHYLYAAHAAGRLLNVAHGELDFAPPQPGVTIETFDDLEGALKWCAAECSAVLAAIAHAPSAGFDAHTWQLARAFQVYLHRRGLWTAQIIVQHKGLEAARRLGDPAGQAEALMRIAVIYYRTDRLAKAYANCRDALDLYVGSGDLTGQIRAHIHLSNLAARSGHASDVLTHAQRALDLSVATGDELRQANALNAVGGGHSLLGDHQRAIDCCRQAIVLLQNCGDGIGEAVAWDTLGEAYHRSADYHQAIPCYQRALDLTRYLGGDLSAEAETLTHLGDAHDLAGDHETARRTWEQAVHILDGLNDPGAADVRAKLHRAAVR